MNKLFSPPLAHLLKRGHRVILVVAPFAVALVLGAFSFAPAAHAAAAHAAVSSVPPPRPKCQSGVGSDINPNSDLSLDPPAYAILKKGATLENCTDPTATGLWVHGTVVDPRWDGWCAQVRAVFNGVIKDSPKACGPGNDVTFDLPPSDENPGMSSPDVVYLRTICGDVNVKICTHDQEGSKKQVYP